MSDLKLNVYKFNEMVSIHRLKIQHLWFKIWPSKLFSSRKKKTQAKSNRVGNNPKRKKQKNARIVRNKAHRNANSKPKCSCVARCANNNNNNNNNTQIVKNEISTLHASDRSEAVLHTIHVEVDNHNEDLRQNMYALWKEDKYCDVILIAGDGYSRIAAHRVVLVAYSPYFRILFSNCSNDEIKIDRINIGILKQLLGVCYAGIVTVDSTNVSSLYLGAAYLQLNALLMKLDGYIIGHLDNSNCLHYYKLSEHLSRHNLNTATEKYFCIHFSEIIGRPSFLELDAKSLRKLLSLKNLNVPSAIDLFRNVHKWMQHNPDAELSFILPSLRLSLLPAEFLLEHVNPLCRTAESKNLIIEALERHLPSVQTLPIGMKCEQLLVIAGDREQNAEIMEYSIATQEWQTLTVLPTQLRNFSVIYSAALNSLCFMGGYMNSTMSDVVLWNLKTHTFRHLPCAMGARQWAGMTSLNSGSDSDGDLIIVGGRTDYEDLATVERWSLHSGYWRSMMPIKKKRYGARLITVGNLIYCIGGAVNDWHALNSMECYNLTKGQWSSRASLHNQRLLFGIVNEGGVLYVIGGESDVIERYDPGKNDWKELCRIKNSADITACVRHNNCLLAFGQDLLLTSNGDWRSWKPCETFPAINKYIYAAISIPQL